MDHPNTKASQLLAYLCIKQLSRNPSVRRAGSLNLPHLYTDNTSTYSSSGVQPSHSADSGLAPSNNDLSLLTLTRSRRVLQDRYCMDEDRLETLEDQVKQSNETTEELQKKYEEVCSCR